MDLGPGFERPAPRDQFLIVARQLPYSIGPQPTAARHLVGHELAVVGSRLEIVERADRSDRSAERRMKRDILRQAPVDEDVAAVLQALDMAGTGLDYADLLQGSVVNVQWPKRCCLLACLQRPVAAPAEDERRAIFIDG